MEEREKEASRPRLVDFISDNIGEDEAMTADGFDDAIIGIGHRCGQPSLMVYDKAKVIDILMERDEMSHEQALEFYSFNIEGAWVGEGTPMWLDRFEDYE
jgi:hypothetical protein|tara:strand:- start:1 stop:300 length:300 start_codon:yes stop_codon:yes gene_type:complete